MARVLILSLVFAPDGVSTSTIVSALAQDLCELGHQVKVITTVPHYNVEPEARARQPLTKRLSGLFYTSTYHTIPVWHTMVARKGEKAGGRIWGFLLYNALSFLIGLFTGKQDVILVVSPPLTSGVVSWLLGKLKGARTLYNVQELYPDTYVTIGTLRPDARSTRLLYRVERFVYRVTDVLTVIGGAFKRAIEAKNVPFKAIQVIPNFVDLEEIQPGSKENPLAMEYGLRDKFVVLYAGNLGLTQSFDTLLDAAAALQLLPDLRIMIVGDGVRREDIEQRIERDHLSNVVLLPYQPRSRVPDIYATADIGLVPLMAGNAGTTLPSKLYTIMASGRAVLAAVDVDSDITKTVNDADCGYAVPPDNLEALKTAITAAYQNRDQVQGFGANGRRYAETHYARRAISQSYHLLIEQLTKKQQ